MSEVFIDNKYQGGYVGDLETLANHFQGGDINNPLDVDDIEALISSQNNIDLIIDNKIPLTTEARGTLDKLLKFHDKDYINNFRSTYFTEQENDTLPKPTVEEVAETTEEPTSEPSFKEQLFNALKSKNLYSSDYNAFQEQFSTPENQQELFKVLKRKKLYSKDAGAFMNTFFPITDETIEEVETTEEVETQVDPHITYDKLTNLDAYESTFQSEEVFGGSLLIDKEKAMVKNLQDHYGEEFSFTVQDEFGRNDVVVATTGDSKTATVKNGRKHEIDTSNKMYKNNPEKYLQRFYGWVEQSKKDSKVEAVTNREVDAVTGEISKTAGLAPTESNDEKIKSLEKVIENEVGPSQKKADAEAELVEYKETKREKEFDQTAIKEKELTEQYNTELQQKQDTHFEYLKNEGINEDSSEWRAEMDKIRKQHDKNFGKRRLAIVNDYQGTYEDRKTSKKEKTKFSHLDKKTHTKEEIYTAAIANLKKDIPRGYGLGFVGEEGENTFDWLPSEDEWKLLDGMSFQEIEELAGVRLDGDDAGMDATLWDSRKKRDQVDAIRFKLTKQDARDASRKLKVLEDEIKVIQQEKEDLDGVRSDLDARAEEWKTGGLVDLENLSKEIDGLPQPTTQEELDYYQDKVDQYNMLREEGLALQRDTDNYNTSLEAYNKKTTEFGVQVEAAEAMKSDAIGKYGFEIVEGVWKDNSTNFKSIKDYEKWRKEHKITHSFFDKDAWAVLGQGLVNTAAKYYTGTSLWALNGLDAATGGAFSMGDERYTRLDALNSMYEKYTDYDYFGKATAEDYGEKGGPSGFLNKGSLAIAEGLPFMLAIAASSGRSGFKPNMFTRTLGKKLLDVEFANKIRMAQTAFHITAMDNTLEGKAMGLNDKQAWAYGGIVGTVTGMTQMIMPDAQFFKGGVIDKVLKDGLGTTLKGFTTKEGLEFAGERWATNVLKEIVEEEAEMVLSDVAKASFGLGHSLESTELKNHLKLIHDTAWLSGGMGAVGAKKDFKNIEKSVNNQLKGDLAEHMKTIDYMASEMTKKLQEAQVNGDTEAIAAYEFELGRLKDAAEYANNFKAAINVAPKNVTDEDLTLLTEKIRLENLKKNQDPAFHAAIDQQLEKINEKIEKSTIQQKASETSKKLMEQITTNVKKLAGANGSQVKEFGSISGDGATPGSPPAKTAKEEIDDYINQKNEDGSYVFDEGTRAAVMNEGIIYGSYVKDKKGNKILLLNKDSDGTVEGANAAAHEFLHQMLETTYAARDAAGNIIRDQDGNIKVDKKKAIGIGMELGKWVVESQGQDFMNSEMKRRLDRAYGGDPANVQMQEVLNTLSDAMVSGDLVFEETAFDKLRGVMRRTFQKMGMDVKFNTGKDVFNFIKDYNKTVSQGKKLSKAQQKVMQQGAQVGGVVAESISSEQVAEIQQTEDLNYKKQLLFDNGIDPDSELGRTFLMSKPSNVGALLNRFDGNKRKMISESISKTKDGRDVMDLKNRKGEYAEDNFFQSEFGQEIAPITETIAKRLFDPIPVNLRNGVTRARYLNELTVIASSLVEREFDPAKQDIDKFISNRLNLRANKLASDLGIESTVEEGGLGAAVGLEAVAELTTEESGSTAIDKNKIILSDRLGVKNKVDKAIKAKLSGLDIENLNFKTLKDQTPEVTGEMFGISPKKLISGANITKKELQSAQMFISKNADVLISMLPEGATASGTATGVPKTLLTPFYTKTDRAKMAKTGTKAGLAVQVKKPNISKAEFLEVFGIVDGVPNRTDRNTSARVLAIANQTGKMMTNQAVRQEVEKQGDVSQSIVLKLQDGKSSVMFSKAIPESKHDIYYTKYGDLVAEVSNSNNKDLESIKNRVTNTFKDDLTKNEILKVSKEIFKNVKDYGILKNKHVMPSGKKVAMPQTLQEFLIDKAVENNLDYGVKEMLKKYLPKDEDGKTINIGTHYLDKNRILKHRALPVDLGKQIVEEMGLEKGVEFILKYYQGMFSGLSRIADGRYIFKNGALINNPNYKPLVEKKGKMVPPKNRKQVFQSVPDFVENVIGKLGVNVYNKDGSIKTVNQIQKDLGINTTLLAEKSEAALKDMNFFGREAQANEAKKAVIKMMDFVTKTEGYDSADVGMLVTSMGSGMTSVMRRAANFKYIGVGVENSKNPGKELEYEHMIPQVEMSLKVLKGYLENGGVDNSIWEGYHVAIIPKTMDKVLIEKGFRSKSPVSGNRYYNMKTFGDKRLVPIKSIDPADNGKIIGEDFVKAGNILNGTIKEIQDMGVISRAYMFSRPVNPARGITVLDFDDTLATTKSGVRAKIPNPDGTPKPKRKVIFLAGGAGSGKGNVISKLGLEDQGFKVVNSDISLEWLKKNNGLPENMNDFTKEQRSKLGSLQHQARGIAKRKMTKYKGNADGVVVDGTGGSIKSMEKLVNEFKDKGYDVSMMFVETSLPVALQRNAARKERSLLDKIVTKNHEAVQGNKDGFKQMFGDRFMEVNTDNLSQQDAMPTKLTEQMNDFVSGYENRRLDAEEFASEGADILDQGGTFDFSEFNKVVEGQTAPLFEKAMKLQGKFGNKDMFVLTARPAESAPAIFEFLKANGLNIPIENITGLANSTPESKALWMADKVGEGYNDFYFADDALQNVQAVQNILDQMDVKSKVQQAKVKFSKGASQTFNNILESTTGVESIKEFSNAQAKLRGQKTKYKSIIPASAQDFQGLLYNFLGKGKKGEADMAFFKKALIDPFARGINELNASRQAAANDFENLNKQFPDVKKKLNKNIEGLDYTYDQAMRVYLWNQSGFEVPGLSKRDLAALTSVIQNDPKLQAYADAIGLISKKEDGYSQPKDYWLAESIASDLLSDGAIGDKRSDFLAEWKQNKDMIFSAENLNKIEAIYGSKFREALEDILYRMETGRNRPMGGGRLVNGFMNWTNNSVGAIMFLNLRSATLQTISAVNYVNWTDNNPAKAAAAFANQPQFWRDFSYIFNSDYLKQRRSGNQRGVNEAELSEAVAGSDNKAKAAIAWLLKKGFTPTQIADSFAISMGGATFYRNRIKTYVKEGMTTEQAEKQAFLDLQETTEVNQQSARPDMISQQQASPLGRLILAFQNTPMQYARIMNKATRDLANGRGDYRAHISKIAYYGFVQSVIFGALQSALYASLGDDDEEDFDRKKERILNQMVDSWLTGIGYGGKAIGTVKNTIMEYLKQRDKGFKADHAYTLLTLLSFSPPIGSKLRKVYSSIQTEQFNRGVFTKRGFTLDNPIWSGVGNVIEGVTNVPLGRMSNLMLQLDNAMDPAHKWWQRVALLLGQNTWDLGIKDPDIEAVKDELELEKKEASKEKQRIKKEQKKKEKEAEGIEKQKKEKKQGKELTCLVCKLPVVKGKKYCTIHEKKEQNKSGKKKQCRKYKSDGSRCKVKTSNKSGYCYYHD